MRNKWKKALMVVFGATLILAACGDDGDKKEGSPKKKYKVGVTQIVEHPSLDAAYDGFKKALEDAGLDVEYDENNAQNDQSANTSIAQKLVSSEVDLIFANSTPSAQAVASATQDVPIIFTSVTDPVGAELVESLEKPGGNLTGTIDLHPEVIPNTLMFLKEELGAQNIGIVYNSGEQNARVQVDTVNELAKDMGLTIFEATISTSAEVKQATESLVGKVDSFYIIKDNTVVSALESVIEVAVANQLPMMVGELDSVKRGGLAAYGFEYFDLGYQTGQMAVKVLKEGNEPASLPVQTPQSLTFVVNEETAVKMGIEIKDDWHSEVSE